MVRDLRLNNYQATKLRVINAEKVAKMAAIERKNAGNPKLIDEQCNGVCKERDKEFQDFLSTDQYSAYFGSRATYYHAVQNPAPARANNASVAPARTKPVNRPAGNLGRNAR